MASPGDPRARTMVKHLKVLMPPSLRKLRISDELAGCFDGGGGYGDRTPTALVVGPLGKVWRVEVGRDDDGAFLGRGWAEFLAAHGFGLGWFVVLRHEGGGVVTIKAFDTSFCIRGLGAPTAGIDFHDIPISMDDAKLVTASGGSKAITCKPQFIRLMHQDYMEKMMMPVKFAKYHVTEAQLNSRMAVICSPRGKFWRIALEIDRSNVFFAGGWSQFLKVHGISEGEVLLLRYEGNMVFKFKVFGLNGCQKDFNNRNTEFQQNTGKEQEASSLIRKRKINNERSSYKEKKRPKTSTTSSNKASTLKGADHQIQTPFLTDKEITGYPLKRPLFRLPVKVCHSIGFREHCTITLKTAIESTRSWKVSGLAYRKSCYLSGDGWKRFCQENSLKEGDLCTFKVIETAVWHVVITRSSTLTDPQRTKVAPSSPSRSECDQRNAKSRNEGHVRPKISMNSLKKASSYTRAEYEIGDSSSIKKKINTSTLKQLVSNTSTLKQLFLAQSICDAIGLQEPCTMITLKTLVINSTRSWQVRGRQQKGKGYLIGFGWREFCQENRLKAGDVCTFNITKPALWHVNITRQ